MCSAPENSNPRYRHLCIWVDPARHPMLYSYSGFYETIFVLVLEIHFPERDCNLPWSSGSLCWIWNRGSFSRTNQLWYSGSKFFSNSINQIHQQLKKRLTNCLSLSEDVGLTFFPGRPWQPQCCWNAWWLLDRAWWSVSQDWKRNNFKVYKQNIEPFYSLEPWKRPMSSRTELASPKLAGHMEAATSLGPLRSPLGRFSSWISFIPTTRFLRRTTSQRTTILTGSCRTVSGQILMESRRN